MLLRKVARSTFATLRSGLVSAKGLKRSAAINGLAVSVGVGLASVIGVVAPQHASAVILGAICVSVADTPASTLEKLKRLALAWCLATLALTIALATMQDPIGEAATAMGVGFGAALLSAFGRNAIPISIATLMGLVFARSVATPGESLLAPAGWFAIGGLAYGAFAAVATPLLANQTKRQVLREALDAAAKFLRAQRNLLDRKGEEGASDASVIDALSLLAERIQAARDIVFISVDSVQGRFYAAVLVVLVDLFEAAVSEQADLDALLELTEGEPLRSLRALLLLAASDIDRFSRSLVDKKWREMSSIIDRRARLQKLTEWDGDDDPMLRQPILATAIKIERLFARIDKLWSISASPEEARASLQGIDLDHFVQRVRFDFGALKQQVGLGAPVGRFAIRLSLALFMGCLLGEALPTQAHGSWILLTIALVMRANYSVTRQRRDQRLLGNVLGGAITAVILSVTPTPALPFVAFAASGLAHAFALQSYLVASIGSCVMSLVLIHGTEAGGDGFFFLMRVMDTGLGAAVAFVFSFLLPTWERKMIASQAADLARTGLEYARSALSLDVDGQHYRLERRRMYDLTAALSASARRILDEPGAPHRQARALTGLLSASYAFSAEMASIHLYLFSRPENERRLAAPGLARARRLIEMAFARRGALRRATDVGERDFVDAGALARRLGRAVRASRRLASTAAKIEAAASIETSDAN